MGSKSDSFRAKHNRRSAKALFEQIKAEGYDGGYSQLTAFVRSWRGEQGKSLRAFVPLTFALGEAFQFDWSEEGLLIGGLFRRIQVSHMKLCASRAFWLVAYPGQGHEMLFDAHTRSFGALGGVPRRGIYDNMKTAVDKVNKGKGRTVNARFAVMCAHYLFDPDFCARWCLPFRLKGMQVILGGGAGQAKGFRDRLIKWKEGLVNDATFRPMESKALDDITQHFTGLLSAEANSGGRVSRRATNFLHIPVAQTALCLWELVLPAMGALP